MSPSSRARWAMLSQLLSGAASRARSSETSWSKRSSDRCDMCLPFYRVWFISKVSEQLPQLRSRLEQLRFRSAGSDSELRPDLTVRVALDRKSTRLNSSHGYISYAVFCLKKKKK